jgi:peroxiredoxin
MQRILPVFLFLAFSLACYRPALAGQASEAPASAPVKVGAAFPDLSFKEKLSKEQAAYLGLGQAGKTVRLSAVKAPLILIEVFSMYCPHCQREAPVMNDFYALVEQRGLAGKLKIVGIGAGNSDSEVDIFRAKYGQPFPLFSDLDFKAHAALGKVGTPHFYLVARDMKTGALTVKFSRLGRMDSPEKFLDELLTAAGTPQGDAQ